MRVDMMRRNLALPEAAAVASAAESAGFDALWTSETAHDPFPPLAVAAEHTNRIALGTAVAVAFARSPTTVAHLAWDLQAYSGGRFLLGLGTQVGAHVTRRFSMPWSQPAARMREYVRALRAIWRTWADGDALDFRGDFYTLTLMTPNFTPPPQPHGPPPVFVGGVGPALTEAAGEVADGFLCHGFTTETYLREVTLPRLRAGLARAGRSRSDIEVAAGTSVVTGRTPEEVAAVTEATRAKIAFYASTPAYRRVLDHHGWGALQDETARLVREGRWGELAACVDDEVLSAFVVAGEPADVARRVVDRLRGIADRVSIDLLGDADAGLRDAVLLAVKDAAAGTVA